MLLENVILFYFHLSKGNISALVVKLFSPRSYSWTEGGIVLAEMLSVGPELISTGLSGAGALATRVSV